MLIRVRAEFIEIVIGIKKLVVVVGVVARLVDKYD